MNDFPLDGLGVYESGKSLRVFADENIFRPTGMANTHLDDEGMAVVLHSGMALPIAVSNAGAK